MSSINVLNVIVLNPITRFRDQLQFEIVFECLSELKNGIFIDIEWKVIYIGSAEDDTYDQVLDSVLIGPLQVGSMKFILEVNKLYILGCCS
jgi:histone chaperone ASF1